MSTCLLAILALLLTLRWSAQKTVNNEFHLKHTKAADVLMTLYPIDNENHNQVRESKSNWRIGMKLAQREASENQNQVEEWQWESKLKSESSQRIRIKIEIKLENQDQVRESESKSKSSWRIRIKSENQNQNQNQVGKSESELSWGRKRVHFWATVVYSYDQWTFWL